MSIQHNHLLGSDQKNRLQLNITGLDENSRDVSSLSADFYAYDSKNGESVFTCNLSINELQALYHFLNKYSAIRESDQTETGNFIELSEDIEALITLLESVESDRLVQTLQKIVSDRLSEDDVNTILGRKAALDVFHEMLSNSQNYSEEDWQIFFEKNDWILGYGLKYRFLKILQREAHVGDNITLGGRNEVIPDFLLSDTRFTKIVELKKPNTSLFNPKKNRGDSWSLSTELTDAVSQILAQKANWELKSNGENYLRNGDKVTESTYDVESILIIGSIANIDGNDQEKAVKKKTLELYRRNLRNIEILFFDELYERAKYIIYQSTTDVEYQSETV